MLFTHRNVTLLASLLSGVCGIDELLVIGGGDTLTPDEAISFLNIQVSVEGCWIGTKYPRPNMSDTYINLS